VLLDVFLVYSALIKKAAEIISVAFLICAFLGLETEIFCLNVVFGFFFEKDKRIHSQAKAKDTFFPKNHKIFAYNRPFLSPND